MHGDWDGQTETWDSLAEEYKWDVIEYRDTVSLGFRSGFAEPTPETSFELFSSLGTTSGFKTDSEGSVFDEVKSFDCGSKVAGWLNSITGFETVSLGAKSGVDYLEYHLFMNSYGLLSMASLLGAEPNTNVTLNASFSTGTNMTSSPAGSTFNQSSELKMRTRMSPDGSNSILRDVCLFALDSGIEETQNTVSFQGECSLGMKASVWGLGVTTINLSGSLGMVADLFAASGNTFFESCVFNGVIADEYTVNYTARDVAFLGSVIGLDETSLVSFSLEESLSMGTGYTARDGWWIRPVESESSGWGDDNTVSGDWTADSEGSSRGWIPGEF